MFAAMESGKAWFGFREVETSEKPQLVRDVFERVASRYDLMNDLMSGGIHRWWKAALIDWLAPKPGQLLLDVAGGTGDIARGFLAKAGHDARVVVCDLTPAMLAVGRDRSIDKGIVVGIDWVAGDALALPIAERSVDAYTIAFGLRNLADIDRALEEACRVLRPGGRFLCLEFSQVVLPLLKELYDLYSFRVVPWMGRIVTGERDSYVYLVESIRRFPAQEELRERLAAAGLVRASFRNLSGGIAALHSAWRI